MFNQKMIGIMRCSLPTANIDKINLCVANIEMHFHYHFIPYIGQDYFNLLRNVLFIEKSAVGQLIIVNKNMMI